MTVRVPRNAAGGRGPAWGFFRRLGGPHGGEQLLAARAGVKQPAPGDGAVLGHGLRRSMWCAGCLFWIWGFLCRSWAVMGAVRSVSGAAGGLGADICCRGAGPWQRWPASITSSLRLRGPGGAHPLVGCAALRVGRGLLKMGTLKGSLRPSAPTRLPRPRSLRSASAKPSRDGAPPGGAREARGAGQAGCPVPKAGGPPLRLALSFVPLLALVGAQDQAQGRSREPVDVPQFGLRGIGDRASPPAVGS